MRLILKIFGFTFPVLLLLDQAEMNLAEKNLNMCNTLLSKIEFIT